MELSRFEKVEPVHLEWSADSQVRIVWDDAHESLYPLSYLREKCPCATCRGTHGPPTTLVVRTNKSGFNIMQGGAQRKEPSTEVKRVDPVGTYAMRFTWGDGHNSGIFSYRYLRSICPTEVASAEAAAKAAADATPAPSTSEAEESVS